MTVPRCLLVLLLLVLCGVAVVLIRQESARAAHRIQELHHERLMLEQKLWSNQLTLAKLRGPEAIRQRAEELGVNVTTPRESSGRE